jgi:hypothetical protein
MRHAFSWKNKPNLHHARDVNSPVFFGETPGRRCALTVLLMAAAAFAAPPARAQEPSGSSPAPTAPAEVKESTSSVIKAGDGLHIAGEAGEKPKPKLSRPIKAHVPKAAKDWEPIGLQEGGDPYQGATGVTLKLVKSGKGYKGERSKAKAWAKAYPVKTGETLFVIAVFPAKLEKRRKHFELRLRVVEGNVEKVEASLITVRDRRDYRGIDRVALRRAGAAFEEEFAASGVVSLAAFDPKPGRGLNAGRLSRAEFPDREVGFADVSWSLKSVEKP